MYCKNIKIKLNKQVICRITNKPIDIRKCTMNCKNYVSKNQKCTIDKKKMCNIKNKTYKLAKLEKNRFSIITNNLEVCILCGAKRDNLHEVFGGRNRANSMKYGIVIPLCLKHHAEIHKNKELQEIYHKIGQDRFNLHYSNLNFIEIFKKNYL